MCAAAAPDAGLSTVTDAARGRVGVGGGKRGSAINAAANKGRKVDYVCTPLECAHDAEGRVQCMLGGYLTAGVAD